MLQVDIIREELRYKNAFIITSQRSKDQMRLRDDDIPLRGLLSFKMWAAMIIL